MCGRHSAKSFSENVVTEKVIKILKVVSFFARENGSTPFNKDNRTKFSGEKNKNNKASRGVHFCEKSCLLYGYCPDPVRFQRFLLVEKTRF